MISPWADVSIILQGRLLELATDLQKAVFISRLNRFAAVFELDGKEVVAHVPNSGRLRELLVEGTPMLLTPAFKAQRKTSYDLALVQLEDTLVSADARLPNRLVYEAISGGRMPQFTGYGRIRREATFGESRLDLLLTGERELCYVEAKSVTLVENGVGLFPDAPTDRGRRHVEALSEAVLQGNRGAVVFVIQRGDASRFSTHDEADPRFGQALRGAVRAGVEAYAYTCVVTRERIELASPVPLCL